MNSLINDVISNVVLSSKTCCKFLENDGISTRVFLLKSFDNKKLINYKDVKILRNKIPSVGLAITIVKNFDEYQYILCDYVPKLNDNNFYKIKFQKIRILIFLFFKSLSTFLTENMDNNILIEWIREANFLLMETSQIILDYRETLRNSDGKSTITNSTITIDTLPKNDKLKRDYFNYFGTNEEKIDEILYSIYGIKI
ncbi:MAG TPA: hypothetical protein VGC75_03395 [Candidatus Nitrosocosmicus sp.]